MRFRGYDKARGVPRTFFVVLQSELLGTLSSSLRRVITFDQPPARKAEGSTQERGFQRAASRQAHRWMTQPSRKNQSAPVKRKKRIAASRRPWINCPSPGMKKLAREAMTLPAEPCPDGVLMEITLCRNRAPCPACLSFSLVSATLWVQPFAHGSAPDTRPPAPGP